MPEFTTHPTMYRIPTSAGADPTAALPFPASAEYRNV
jgi:hypothetical protein